MSEKGLYEKSQVAKDNYFWPHPRSCGVTRRISLSNLVKIFNYNLTTNVLVPADTAWRSVTFLNQTEWLKFRFSTWQYFTFDFIVLIRALKNRNVIWKWEGQLMMEVELGELQMHLTIKKVIFYKTGNIIHDSSVWCSLWMLSLYMCCWPWYLFLLGSKVPFHP